MKLDKFQIRKDRAGSPGHREAVACCNRGIGGLSVKLACSAAGKDGVGCPDNLKAAFVLADNSETAAAIIGEQVNSIEIFDYFDVLI